MAPKTKLSKAEALPASKLTYKGTYDVRRNLKNWPQKAVPTSGFSTNIIDMIRSAIETLKERNGSSYVLKC